jgi:hypothetical protein
MKRKSHIPLSYLGYGGCPNQARLESITNFRVCMKNREFRSVMNGFFSISTKINAKEVIGISTCVARKNGVNDMANKTAWEVSPIA